MQSRRASSQKENNQNTTVTLPPTDFSETEFYSFRPVKISDMKLSALSNTTFYVLQRNDINQGGIESLRVPHHTSNISVPQAKQPGKMTVIHPTPINQPGKKAAKNTNPLGNSSEDILTNDTKLAPAKKEQKTPMVVKKGFNYRKITIGKLTFSTASKAAVHMLTNTTLSQSEITRRCGISQPCVCQLSSSIR